MHVLALGQVGLVGVLVGAELVEEVGERVPELDHALRGYGDLGAGAAARYRLRHAQKAAARILLQVQVVAAVVLDHHLAAQFPVLRHVLRIRRT